MWTLRVHAKWQQLNLLPHILMSADYGLVIILQVVRGLPFPSLSTNILLSPQTILTSTASQTDILTLARYASAFFWHLVRDREMGLL